MSEATHESKQRLLDAALAVIRAKGYSAARVDDICDAAGLTKGSFFHHFKNKEELAVAAAEYWACTTGQFFACAPYHDAADPLDRVLGYIDFRYAIIQGDLPDYTCLIGTMVQEQYDSNPAIREACERCIYGHAAEVAKDIDLAKARYAPDADWNAMDLAVHSQAVIQGAFIVAKARLSMDVALASVTHLRRYIEFLFSHPKGKA
ncbi:MAG: TetR/AcrR family transcriptional regulator [Alphaproteobacteria bacterium]|nr:TetR/AcrR family transcriptional regulator [Pseudomonadota bacterium]